MRACTCACARNDALRPRRLARPHWDEHAHTGVCLRVQDRTCLSNDDLEGLNFLYPVCEGAFEPLIETGEPLCLKVPMPMHMSMSMVSRSASGCAPPRTCHDYPMPTPMTMSMSMTILVRLAAGWIAWTGRQTHSVD